MSYKKAEDFLPWEVIELIQHYVDGESIYIPRKAERKKAWGSGTTTRQDLKVRNANIYKDFLSGIDTHTLSRDYYLSLKSIQRIILQERKRRL
ncbi:CD3324 family protein [Lysinibacillus odysseyi]|uniref:Histidine kinase n=1 Tax=Lysinibacillus odysseyi 34hs-1 = NBRC 100172 TaxID=1220589 RepID=A0A0A3IHY6_9BACI|nr:CD3324 family protein [Lysinibacillus odysseyi]KGR84381.1 histidine kinase [Lysinibacillus odysseyi 34hs-1 = NBRC 100172]